LEGVGVSELPVNPWSLTDRVKVTSAADEMEYQVSAGILPKNMQVKRKIFLLSSHILV